MTLTCDWGKLVRVNTMLQNVFFLGGGSVSDIALNLEITSNILYSVFEHI